MAYWLFKEEPSHYSFDDLEREGSTVWSGVKNNLARKHLRQVRTGDRIWYYHTGTEKAIVGEMQAVSDARTAVERGDVQAVVVNVRPIRRLEKTVTLMQIKKDPVLADWELIRLPRLSVIPVTRVQWRQVEKLSQT